MSKQRASKLDQYAERLEEWFRAGQTLAQVQDQLRQDGCQVSLGRLSEWWSARQAEMQEESLLNQIASGARQCKDVESALGKNPAPELHTLMALHRTLILQLSTQSQANPELLELVNRMMDRVIKAMRLDQLAERNKLDERRIKLLEERAKQAEQAEKVTASSVSDEEKVARMKAIFGCC